MKLDYFEQKRKRQRRILLPITFLFQALSLSAMVFHILKIENFLFSRYEIYFAVHYKTFEELFEWDGFSLGIIFSSVLIAVSLIFFLVLAFIKYDRAIIRIISAIFIILCAATYVLFWVHFLHHMDLSQYRGSRLQSFDILTYDVFRDNIYLLFWYYFAIITGGLIAAVFAFLNPRGWRSSKEDEKNDLAASTGASTIVTRGNPDVPKCHWYTEALNMCTLTDEYISPDAKRFLRYCSSGNCINCPAYR